MSRLSARLASIEKLILVLAFFGLNLISLRAQGLSLDMGGATLKMEPESLQEEVAAGRLVSGQILGAAKLLPDANLQRYVNLVGRRIADQTERRDLAWSFGVVDSIAVNAFASPGGQILMTSQLLQLI